MTALPTATPATAAESAMLERLLTGSTLDLAQVLRAADAAGLVHIEDDALHDLMAHGARAVASGSRAMTVAEFYVAVVVPTARASSGAEHRGGGMFRTYQPYWKLMVFGYPYQRAGVRTSMGTLVGADPVLPEERLYPGLGDRQLTDVRYRDLKEVVDWAKIRSELSAHWRTLRREDRGRAIQKFNHEGAVRNAVSAIRYFYAQAVLDERISPQRDISQRLKKPSKKVSSRRGFTDPEYKEFWAAVIGGGDDPELDRLLVYTVFITGARREGLINLSRRDIDLERVTVWLDEKGDSICEQPATRALLEELLAFAASRGATRPEDPIFCYRDSTTRGRPHRLTDRRFDTLHTRLQRTLPWADRRGVTIHSCRHHIIRAIERVASEAVAARFARHNSGGGVTREYDKATGEEVCTALSAVTGTQHPLSDAGW